MSLLGVPAEHVAGMRQYPMWPMWEAVAPTMAYDAAALGDEAAVPVARAAGATTPTLIVTGSESYPFMQTLVQCWPRPSRRANTACSQARLMRWHRKRSPRS